MTTPFIEMRGISKKFADVQVLSSVDFSCGRGEIHGLIGANGAGKSTLIKTLSGIYSPTEGSIFVDGKETVIQSPAQASALGISVIHQEFDLIPQMTVAQNLFLGREPRKKGFWGKLGAVDFDRLYADTRAYLALVGLDVQPWQLASELSIEQKQLAAIAKVLSQDARLIVMDEPTAALNGAEVERLLKLIGDISQRGCGVIFISHHMEEVMQISHRITVLRDGCVAATRDRADMDEETAVRLMTGKDVVQKRLRGQPPREAAVLDVRRLSRAGSFTGVSFTLHAGEIMGMVGLEGQGQREILRALYGDCGVDGGEVWLMGAKLDLRSPSDTLARGVVFVPEERKEEGLCLHLDVNQNMALSTLHRRADHGVIRTAAEREEVLRFMSAVRLSPADPAKVVGTLSGGNQQKVVVARCLACRPSVLLFAEPTRGIDVGAKEEIYRLIRSMADSGSSILVVSGDISELQLICDRILVVHRGRIVDSIDGEEATRERLMRSMWGMGGAKREEEPA